MREGNKGQHRRERGQDHRPRALYRRLDNGVIIIKAGRTVLLDLFSQDQRVAHQDSGKSDQAEDGVEAEGLVEDEQRRHDADKAERRRQQDHGHRREGSHLQHDDDERGCDHDREDLRQRGVGLGRLLDRSAHFDAVAGRKGRDQRLERRHDLFGNLRRLGRFIDFRADRDDRRAIAALHDRLFQTDLRLTDLVERNRTAVAARQREIRQTRGIEPLATGAACHDGDIADVLTDLRDGDAGEKELELLPHLRR